MKSYSCVGTTGVNRGGLEELHPSGGDPSTNVALAWMAAVSWKTREVGQVVVVLHKLGEILLKTRLGLLGPNPE